MSKTNDIYIHPERFPKNVQGPFYTLGSVGADGKWCGQCLSCTIPEAEAPTLLAPLDENNSDTYFVHQPETELEIQQACRAAEVCCVDAIRYGGKDRKIIERLGAELCDYASLFGVSEKFSTHSKTKHTWWQFWK